MSAEPGDGENGTPETAASPPPIPADSHVSRPGVLARVQRVLWRKWIELELATYNEAAPEGLDKAVTEAGKQTRTTLVFFLSITAYSLLVIAKIQDADFYGLDGSITLPAVSLGVPPGVFFLVAPIILLILWLVLQLQLGHSQRLLRRLALKNSAQLDPDPLHPTLETLAHHRGITGGIAKTIQAMLAWYALAAVYLVYWYRLLPLRSTIHGWAFGDEPPSARAMAVFLLVYSAVAAIWSIARASVHCELLHRRGVHWLTKVVALLLVATSVWLCVFSAHYADRRRAVNLEKAVLSRPPGLTGVVGCRLAGVNLEGANLRGAFLASADLSGADLSHAELDNANFEGANLFNAELVAAHLGSAKFDRVQANGADLTSVFIQKATMVGAQLSHAKLRSAVILDSDLTKASLAFVQAESAIIYGSKLDGADFSMATLYLADLRWNRMRGANFSAERLRVFGGPTTHAECSFFAHSDLRAANFRGVPLAGADFSGARLQGVDFRDATVVYERPTPVPTLPEAIFARARIEVDSPEEQNMRAEFAACFSPKSGVLIDGAEADAICSRKPQPQWTTVAGDEECRALEMKTLDTVAQEKDAAATAPDWLQAEDNQEYAAARMRAVGLSVQDWLQYKYGPTRIRGATKIAEQLRRQAEMGSGSGSGSGSW